MLNTFFRVLRQIWSTAAGKVAIVAVVTSVGSGVVIGVVRMRAVDQPVSPGVAQQVGQDSSLEQNSPTSSEKNVTATDKKTPDGQASNPAATTPVTAPSTGTVTPPTTGGSTGGQAPTGGFQANCIVVPSVCGYPDATNTGVPAGTSLSNSGSMTVTQNGAIVENMNITGQIIIQANNVTIRKSRITSGDYYPIDYDGYTGLLVEDTEIVGTSSVVTAGMSFRDYTARRVYIRGTIDGFKADANVLIEDSFVTNLVYDPIADTHNDVVQTTGGSNVTLRHNTFKLGNVPGISAIIQMGTEWGPNSNWLVINNLIDGGGWSINAGSGGTNRVFTNNRFTRAHGYGVGDVPSSTWSGNYYDDNNAAITK